MPSFIANRTRLKSAKVFRKSFDDINLHGKPITGYVLPDKDYLDKLDKDSDEYIINKNWNDFIMLNLFGKEYLDEMEKEPSDVMMFPIPETRVNKSFNIHSVLNGEDL